MGFCLKVSLVLVLLLAIGIGYFYNSLTQVPPLPQLDSVWWGPGKSQKVDESIRPFTISISKEVLDDLSKRLELAPKFTPPLEDIGFQYGFNTEYFKTVIDFWKTKYNWKEREGYLNSLPQFKTKVDGLDIHFIHAKPKKISKTVQVLPLLLLHGWPGSVREFYELIPLLTTPREGFDFVFEVIAPSLPGYGFSEGAAKPGLGAAQMAVVMNDLMTRLGFNKFYVQGGDWGAIIATNMATLFPSRLLGLHSNMCAANSPVTNLKLFLGSFWPSLVVSDEVKDRVYPLGKTFSWILQESGYMHLQATKPDTIGIALQNSPVGLAAYILEKFSSWTNPAWQTRKDGGLTEKFKLVDLLDNIMIYWVTGSITTSVRLYSETFNKAQYGLQLDSIPTTVPTACVRTPFELMYLPDSLLREKYHNLVRATDISRGGHFAAFEEPGLIADDIWDSIKLIRQPKKN